MRYTDYEVIWSEFDLNFRWVGRGNRSKNRNSASDVMSAEEEGTLRMRKEY
jgi:hypothetical protein